MARTVRPKRKELTDGVASKKPCFAQVTAKAAPQTAKDTTKKPWNKVAPVPEGFSKAEGDHFKQSQKCSYDARQRSQVGG